jgi:hypothetical protein
MLFDAVLAAILRDGAEPVIGPRFARTRWCLLTGGRSAFVLGMTTATNWHDGQLTFARQNLSSPFAKNIPLCF